MARLSLIVIATSLAGAFAHPAEPQPDSRDVTVTTYTKPLSELPPNTLSTIAVEPLKDIVPGSDEDEISQNQAFEVISSSCLEPLHRPDLEDCVAICEWLADGAPSVRIDSLETFYFETNNCLFGVANLECQNLIISPRRLAPLCSAIVQGCVYNGFDGFALTSGPRLAIAMSGTEVAPPYPSPACP
ncbi:hypothetical protein FQN54_008139 [Arachnomyces sp. PD_36]|nr:hypothetical protein FQN54_008139 [Arachnomyces sp. PD_36]